ncbi:MAG: class I SAM-dependent methyltransferase [Anaerolineae bacterium]
MIDPYGGLATIYDQAGLGAGSERLRQRLFDRLQRDGWLGRRILDLGCGTGTAACWYATNSYRVTGIDRSAEMLAVARAKAEGLGVVVDWREADIAATDIDDGYDLVTALDVFNELHGIRDLEATVAMAQRALNPDKLLVFDLVTVRGFVEQWAENARVLFDDSEQLFVVVQSAYNFETAVNTRHYTLYNRAGDTWQRSDELHTLRAFNLQAVGAILKRAGFQIQQVFDGAFGRFDPTSDRTGRAIFVAAKTG